MTFYICKGCGKIVGMVKPSKCPTKCCGEPMEEMVPGTTDGALEKHVPAVTINGRDVKVTVGEVLHPMAEEHYIMWITGDETGRTEKITPARRRALRDVRACRGR